ncbi:uncharacterized protein LOC111876576 [Lactuca sativa]|uniref:uncharacterized protein LOC111876576 n=1 Tax=Lactuca sativa TaxID=4236 RepID=UPI000CC6A8CB|nr:uncharacterized protein LOC111876576 [Lactuca sativa]XP_023728898.1 uncharacterized protein LOC111876576 [Lactuca sativa]
MTQSQNDDDTSSSSKRIKTCHNRGVAPWSDLHHDALFIVMMQLGIVDFVAFSKVCKSWRSQALPNRKRFMASKPPMLMYISSHVNMKECYLQDFEGKNFKTILPHSGGRIYAGFTCGYLILYGWATRDFWLVNPITRHELYFPNVPSNVYSGESKVSAILIFSSLTSKLVFLVLKRFNHRIWFSTAGEGTWNHVYTTSFILDIHAFKGKIYTLNYDRYDLTERNLCELRLNPTPKLTTLKTKNSLKQEVYYPMFVSSGENLYVMETYSKDSYKVLEMDFGEMKWVPFEKNRDDYTFFISGSKPGAAVKQDLWVEAQSQSPYMRYDVTDKCEKGRFFTADLWYFPHKCLNADLLNE